MLNHIYCHTKRWACRNKKISQNHRVTFWMWNYHRCTFFASLDTAQCLCRYISGLRDIFSACGRHFYSAANQEKYSLRLSQESEQRPAMFCVSIWIYCFGEKPAVWFRCTVTVFSVYSVCYLALCWKRKAGALCVWSKHSWLDTFLFWRICLAAFFELSCDSKHKINKTSCRYSFFYTWKKICAFL